MVNKFEQLTEKARDTMKTKIESLLKTIGK